MLQIIVGLVVAGYVFVGVVAFALCRTAKESDRALGYEDGAEG